MSGRYPTVALRARHRCEYCRAPEAIFNFPFELEHIIPVARGGSDDESNLALACRSCNLRKAAHVSAEDPDTQEQVGLFNPRCEGWDVHFVVDAESGRIDGRTPAGRATVAGLEMNSSNQVIARRQWMRLGLFP